MSSDTKLSKTHISKTFQSGRSSGSWLGNLGKKVLTSITFPLSRYSLPRLLSGKTPINTFEKQNK